MPAQRPFRIGRLNTSLVDLPVVVGCGKAKHAAVNENGGDGRVQISARRRRKANRAASNPSWENPGSNEEGGIPEIAALSATAMSRSQPTRRRRLMGSESSVSGYLERISTGITTRYKIRNLAICLIGSAHVLEATGYSILQNLLWPSDADVFICSPEDSDAHKLSALLLHNKQSQSDHNEPIATDEQEQEQRWQQPQKRRQPHSGRVDAPQIRIAAVHIFKPELLLASYSARIQDSWQELLSGIDPDTGGSLEDVLQEFGQLQACSVSVRRYETKNFLRYAHIMWAQLDSFWTANVMPVLPHHSSNTDYFIPEGIFGVPAGLNTHFGFGSAAASHAAMRRMSMLTKLPRVGVKNVSPELAFSLWLETQGINVQPVNLPFCTLTRRPVTWPPLPPLGIPVFPAMPMGPKYAGSSSYNLNGALCRPCFPVLTGTVAFNLLRALKHGSTGGTGGTGSRSREIGHIMPPGLCDASNPGWDADWEQNFDSVIGGEAAEFRRKIQNRNFSQCLSDWDEVRANTPAESWHSPSSKEICRRGFLGMPVLIGSELRKWGVFLKPLNPSSIVYCFVSSFPLPSPLLNCPVFFPCILNCLS
ncbi:hypothetical protein CBR_g9154 [Chara braunii]|uniref:DUF7796 domain-containing protein n=1 Tax=Chara braunii TaxID=69332 RepID=A0A388KNY3_CHABU|nr:hypothetical protein CBR_g9154 [Chara braunii]|eukprot:GBG71745.1 hypothetical protein CBR_g9154 [Chara braunii]